MKRKVIGKDKVKAPPTPHSPGVVGGDFLYVSSQGPMDQATGNLVGGSIEEQATAALNSVKAVIKAEGFHVSKIIKVTAFLADIKKDFDGFNKAYNKFFLAEGLTEMNFPARTVVEAKSAFDCKCEIEAIVAR